MKKKSAAKALVLLSGGLDSQLAAKVLVNQGILVTGVVFESLFFNSLEAQKAAKHLKIPLMVIDICDDHLKLIKNPPNGYGSAANPCIDCHALMLQKTKTIMENNDYDFVATGEILGERPLSQNKAALLKIAEISGLKDKLLRPLSAAYLPKTDPEKEGLISVEKLPKIKGRSRKIQLFLAKKYHLDYPQPAGGCILTDKAFGNLLLTTLKKWPKCSKGDLAPLFLGRHLWEGEILITIGRNKKENEDLLNMAQKGDILITPDNFPGPTALIRGKQINQRVVLTTKKLIKKFSKKMYTSKSYTTTTERR